jgi:hypothetical protein
LGVERFLQLYRRDVAVGFVEAAVVEPVDVLQGGDLELFGGAPWPCWFDQLGLEQPDDGLGQGVVVGVAVGSDRGVSSGGDEPVGERD